MTTPVTQSQLLAFIERYERLEAEKKDIADGQKDLMAEASGSGYDVKILRLVIARRKRERDDLAEEAVVLDLYEAALEGRT